MGLLVWMVLVVLVSSVTHLSAVDVNWLTEVFNEIRTEYWIPGQFSLAAKIPLTEDKKKLKEILEQDSFCRAVCDEVKKKEVFIGKRIIIAKPEQNIHAELRVLTNLHHLTPNNEENFLLIYSHLSPCRQCTGQDEDLSILDFISDNLKKGWHDAAFVFTTVYSDMKDGSTISRDVLEDSIYELGESMGGLNKVYRCYGSYRNLQCHSCSFNGGISEVCVDNNAEPEQAGSRSRSQSPNQGPSGKRDRSQSPDQGPSGKRDRSQSPDQSSSKRSRNT